MMKTLVLLCLIAPLAATAGQQAGAKTRKPASQASAKAQKASAETVPADAVLIGPGSWEWTAPDGKVWTYKQTPFGLRRAPRQTEAAPESAKPSSGLTAKEEGDLVRFEHMTPFGKRTWTRKKDEMNEAEQMAWERDCNKAAARPAANDGASQPTGEKDKR